VIRLILPHLTLHGTEFEAKYHGPVLFIIEAGHRHPLDIGRGKNG
jgi:hypothetical protein